jgi:DNA-binding GntR family transcriptional regulator
VAKRGSRPEAVYAVLRCAILEQALGPGAKLPEDTIGEQLGVSRTVVRRALEKLNAEELVELAPNKGACVAQPSLDEARDVFAIRMDLERLVIDRVCGKLTREQAKSLEKSINQEERSYRSGDPDYIRHAADFHVQLAQMSGSPLLLKYVRGLVARSALILGLYGRPDWPDCSMQEHRDFLAALTEGDLKRSRKLMRDHLDGVLTRALETHSDAVAPSIGEVIANYAAALNGK